MASALPILAPKQPSLIVIGLGSAALPDVEGVLELIELTPSGARVRDGNGVYGWLVAPPMMLLAILLGDGASADASGLMDWLKAAGAAQPVVLDWRRGTELATLRRINKDMARLLTQARANQINTAAEVARMRASNAEMHHRFMVAESAMLRSGAMPLDLVFSNDPMPDPVPPVLLSETAGGIAQVLPTGSHGVGAIGIHLSAVAEPVAGAMVAELASLEDGRQLERWIIPAAQLRQGWNMLALTRAVSGQSRTLQLKLARQGSEDRLPSISLGSGQPIMQFQVSDRASGDPLLRNSLALQVWRGLPGAVLPGWLDAHRPARPMREAAGFTEVPLAPARLTQVEHANEGEAQFDFPAVVGPPGERVILCHAPVQGLTLARLPGSAPDETIRFSASAFIDNQQSRDVDFALILAPDTATARAIAAGDLEPEPQQAFSGWCQVNNLQLRRLSALRQVRGGDMAMFVATRMNVPGDNSFARARFKDLSVMVQA